jgi:Family of unknown function (DUF6703)
MGSLLLQRFTGGSPARYGAQPYLHRRTAIGDNLSMAKKRAHRPEGHPAVTPPPAAARRPPRPAATPAPRGARAQFEDASRPLLLRMRALPTFLLPMVLAVALFLGLVIPAWWAGAFLVSIGLFLIWLTALSWPAITPGSRLLRVVVNVGVLALGVLKLLGRL